MKSLSIFSHENRNHRNKNKWILFIFLFTLFILRSIITNRNINLETYLKVFGMRQKNFLDDCRYIYIDMGTNIGIQIRKLYEPHLYPNAPVLPLFKEIFGNNSNEVCSVGFEANPVHENYLKQFENYCLKHNWRVKIFTSTAVSTVEKDLTFYISPRDKIHNQWGASLIAGKKRKHVTVPSIDIISWFKKTVLQRKLPLGFPLSRIMMKSDIEGHDSTVIANLVLSGIYCSIDLIYGEHFTSEFQKSISLLQKYSNSCTTKLIYMDDEKYHNQRFPFIINNPTKMNL